MRLQLTVSTSENFPIINTFVSKLFEYILSEVTTAQDNKPIVYSVLSSKFQLLEPNTSQSIKQFKEILVILLLSTIQPSQEPIILDDVNPGVSPSSTPVGEIGFANPANVYGGNRPSRHPMLSYPFIQKRPNTYLHLTLTLLIQGTG